MKGTSLFKYCTFLLAILALLYSFLLNCAMANVYTVGDQEEWNSQTNYASWAEGYNFSLGDVLVFRYVKEQHNVYEVTEDTFRSCNASSGVLVKYDSGEDRVKLNKVKKYWFICDIPGHCLGGMRFGIDARNSSNATNSTYDTLTPQIEPTTLDNSCRNYIYERWRVIRNLIPLGLLLFNL
ncbi:PREDICTED: basic blue protein-like [Lupinus angustifolius]|uniref:basic blue protein-like n=1 Tax=Lupinus angustifolius TaxID=3871 RepID=UPI00092E38BB|nr:PREDICTED: basic blue protein-like [Lupinus angustifolius]